MPGRDAVDVLATLLPAGRVITDPAIIEGYRYDRARDARVGRPRAVVRPAGTSEVQTVVRWAGRHGVPVIPRGAGTGLSGGAGAVDGCVMLTLEHMRAVAVDPDTRVAVAQPGALNVEIKRAAAEHGLWYPPDPSSFEMSSIGGNVATNAGGLCCVKYGVTGDYVLGLEVVLADGTAVKLGGPRIKDTAGLSLMKLFVGSEGCLGVITEVTVRLLPAPAPASTLVAAFPDMIRAADAVLAITAGLRPSVLELMDRTSVNAVEDKLGMGLDREAGALLLVCSDAPGPASAAEIEAVAQICTRHGATEIHATDDPAEGEALAVARRTVLPALEQRGDLLLEDVGVPLPALSALVEGVAEIAEEYGLTIALVAHAGDGNTHPMIVYDAGAPDSAARAALAFDAVMDLALSLDGTITGEHGVGRLKRGWLPAYLGPEVLALNRRIKTALDPQGLLNPGAVFEN
ncbi:FAD-binding protein [Actinospica durhamensis]|uniref:FAD-binding protein n=1 Tax=Actinospica durhamensis TaxID=1508375 RepID=A0A941IV56_9ACTN|nr:FAD-linked oxidase C-terminal domain-containing protein [Actinospica durhamensis]MBR7838588.1 FAD-binding protein [Actinospica durhamensis]